MLSKPMIRLSPWLLLLGAVLFMTGSVQAIPSTDSSTTVFIEIPEDTAVNTTIRTIRVFDTDGVEEITISIEDQATNAIVFLHQLNTGPNVHADIILRTQQDRDPPSASFRDLKFTAQDSSLNIIRFTITLYLSDVNDNSPSFANLPYRAEIYENRTAGYVVLNATATDPDDGQGGVVTYSLKPDTQSTTTAADYSATFRIDPISGQVILNKTLDYGTNTYYQFDIIAKDGGSPSLNSSTSFIIRILDVQNTPPFFTGIPYRTSVNENVPKSTSVLTVTARDGDTGVSNSVNYTLLGSSTCADVFQLDILTGEITTKSTIDRDSGTVKTVSGVCTLSVQANEIETHEPQLGITTASTDVTITVNDLNDNIPVFNAVAISAKIEENMPTRIPITLLGPSEISVSDIDQGDNSKLNISLKYPNGSECYDFEALPTVIQSYGPITIRVNNTKLLDYEARDKITFLIVATEVANGSHVATATVVLDIVDMNDCSPAFANTSYTFNIPESSLNGSVVGVVTATDRDKKWSNLTYSLLGSSSFMVDPTTGELKTFCSNCSKELDRETTPEFTLTLTATDNGDRSNFTSIHVVLDDVNDNSPVFLRSEYTAVIDENDDDHLTTPLVTVQATDADTGNNKTVRYSLADSEFSSNFTIDNVTGQVLLTHALDYEHLDKELNGVIVIIVQASDLGTPSRRTSSVNVTVTVQDVNDNAPVFSQGLYSGSVLENGTAGDHVSTVSATDGDGTERNANFSFFILSGGDGKFKVNSSSGELGLQVNPNLDRETTPAYNITVVAIDWGAPPLTGSTTVTVNILDVNDEYPEFSKASYSAESKENSTDTVIQVCNASDPDLDSRLQYSIQDIQAIDENQNKVDEDISSYFSIGDTTGAVTLHSVADREVAETIYVTVRVEDLAADDPRPQTATATLTVTLLDVNDNAPEFSKRNYTISVAENARNGTTQATIPATDRDENRTITYSLAAGPSPFHSFGIDPHTGVITKTGPLDRETNETFSLVAMAEDSGVPPRNSTVTVYVTVLDFNDNTPQFDPHNASYKVPEDVETGHVVATISATDADSGNNGVVSYSLESGAAGHFDINETSGEISVSSSLNREAQDSYTITVLAKDSPQDPQNQRTNSTDITIVVLDINDNPPLFSVNYTSLKVKENVGPNSVLTTTLTATDADDPDSNNSRISYSLISNSGTLFAIDTDTGALRTNGSLEGHAGTHNLTVMARGHGAPPMNSTTMVGVTVEDVNLNAPVLDHLPFEDRITVYECARVYSTIFTFNASDEDKGDNARVNFTLSAVDGNLTDFSVGVVNGSLVVRRRLNALARDQYKLQIQASDNGDPVLRSDIKTFDVAVIDVNDNLPSFESPTQTMEVAEESHGEIVGVVSAIDIDSNSKSCYSLQPGTWSGHFAVNKTKGQVTIKVPIDRENISSTDDVKITVNVSDCSLPVNASSYCDDVSDITPSEHPNVTITITVIDINDNPPVFKKSEIQLGMRRTVDQGTTLGIQLKDEVTDRDTPANGEKAWTFRMNGDMQAGGGVEGKVDLFSGSTKCDGDGIAHIFCIGRNGSIVNNKWFNKDLSGFFTIPVLVWDKAGNDTATVKIFLIADSQVVLMTVLDNKTVTALHKDDILRSFSQITEHDFIYDKLDDHKTAGGIVDIHRSDLYFHVVEPITGRVLSAEEAKALVDRFSQSLGSIQSRYKISNIMSPGELEPQGDNSQRTLYTLIAVVALLALGVLVIAWAFYASVSRYRRKLKAATIQSFGGEKSLEMLQTTDLTVPGSNQYAKMNNPLLNAAITEEKKIPLDELSLSSDNSIDLNEVDGPRPDTQYDQLEEREMTMDMYGEDMFVSQPSESPLEAALRAHDQLQAERQTGNHRHSMTSNSSDDVNVANGHMVGYVNNLFDDEELETSEI